MQQPEDYRPPLVLVADDDEMMRSLITAALIEKGFEVKEATDGREALSSFRRLRPDLVILDVDMPVMNGFDACAQLRGLPGGEEVPIVIVTGTDDMASVERAFELGATDFISKPVNWTLLGHRMLYVLRGARTRSALGAREAENRALLEALPDRLALMTRAGQLLKLVENHVDVPLDRNRPLSLKKLLPADAQVAATRALERCLRSGGEQTFEFMEPGSEGRPRYHEVRMLAQTGDTVLAIIRDNTEKRAAEARIHQLAYYDALTSLPNRHLFLQRLDALLEAAGERYVLLFLGIDRFKRLNDTLGHGAGDAALKQVGERLARLKQERQQQGLLTEIARFGGDEFVFLGKETPESDSAALAETLSARISMPVSIDRHQVVLTPSIGIARFPLHGRDGESLVDHAAQALSAAKSSGGNRCELYSQEVAVREQDLLTLEIDLRQALENGELHLNFQPKYELHTGRLLGAEALLRWNHGERGPVSPAVFIPAAEQSGLIVDIDRWVVDAVCRQLRSWEDQGLFCVPVSLNLSGREFCFDRPAVTLQQALLRHGVKPEHLEVEVTETVLMEEAEVAVATLEELRAMGVRLSLDDFGTGYSSMSYLKRFPVHTVKIDRAFVRDLEQSASDRAICHAMVSMIHGLGMEVIAEGIETEAQRDFLLSIGCRHGQGFLLDKPLPAEEFEARLASAAGEVLPSAGQAARAGESLRH